MDTAHTAVDNVVVETLDSHGRVAARERIALGTEGGSFTIGRSAAAQVIIDDAHAAPLHARVEVAPDGAMRVTDLGSLNGVIAGGARHAGAEALPLTDGQLQIGRTRLRLRTTRETLAAEKRDSAGVPSINRLSARAVLRMLLAGAAVCLGYIGYSVWLEAPRDIAPLFVGGLFSSLTALALWGAIWALLSRVLQGEWRWLTHLAIPLSLGAALLVLDFGFDLAWFTLDLRLPRLYEIGLLLLALAALLFLHLTHATSIQRRRAGAIAVLLPALVMGTTQWVQARSQTRNVNYTGEAPKILPPALRLRQGMAVDEFFSQGKQLKEEADKRRKALPYNDAGDDDDDGE
jgi:pSer/pThr/pTyr-binding forkhead associated (FHA) protein